MSGLKFLSVLLPVIAFMPFSAAVAQDFDNDKEYWERRKEYDKKRDEYYRERDKKLDEYYREQDKKRAEYYRERNKKLKEYYKEEAKRQKEYHKDWHDWDEDYDEVILPPWAVAHGYHADHHVYFRDYCTFYDPYRGGYVYMYDDDWRFSRGLPSFLADVDLSRARAQILVDIPLSKRPELYHDRYSRKYPRNPNVHIGIGVQVF